MGVPHSSCYYALLAAIVAVMPAQAAHAEPGWPQVHAAASVRWVMGAGSKGALSAEASFGVSADNALSVDPDAPLKISPEQKKASFQQVIRDAIAKVRGRPDAELFVFLSADGQKGILCGSACWLQQDDLMDVLTGELRDSGVKLSLFCDSCGAGALRGSAEKSLSHLMGPKPKMRLFASSAGDERAYGTAFYDSLKRSQAAIADAVQRGVLPVRRGSAATERLARIHSALWSHSFTQQSVGFLDFGGVLGTQTQQVWSSDGAAALQKLSPQELLVAFSSSPHWEVDSKILERLRQAEGTEKVLVELSRHPLPTVSRYARLARALLNPGTDGAYAELERLKTEFGTDFVKGPLIQEAMDGERPTNPMGRVPCGIDKKVSGWKSWIKF